jgi:hypothetical protein
MSVKITQYCRYTVRADIDNMYMNVLCPNKTLFMELGTGGSHL